MKKQHKLVGRKYYRGSLRRLKKSNGSVEPTDSKMYLQKTNMNAREKKITVGWTKINCPTSGGKTDTNARKIHILK